MDGFSRAFDQGQERYHAGSTKPLLRLVPGLKEVTKPVQLDFTGITSDFPRADRVRLIRLLDQNMRQEFREAEVAEMSAKLDSMYQSENQLPIGFSREIDEGPEEVVEFSLELGTVKAPEEIITQPVANIPPGFPIIENQLPIQFPRRSSEEVQRRAIIADRNRMEACIRGGKITNYSRIASLALAERLDYDLDQVLN